MNEWRQSAAVICTVVLTFAALATLMQFGLAGVRADMSAGFASVRADMSAEHDSIRVQLNSVDRRTARIEGHLFGIEIAPDQEDGE